MTDLRVIPWIRELDEARAVALARSLIYAEVGRLGLAATDFSMSGRVKARDQGVDGRTHFPKDRRSLLPIGPQVWQVKSGSSPPDASREFEPTHTALIEAVRHGYNYVLFWTNDPVDPTATTVKENFQTRLQEIRSDAQATFLFADAIESLCYAHLAVLAQGSTLPLKGIVSLSTWGKQQDFSIPFRADSQRERHMSAIRQHVTSHDSASSTLNLYGDTGVGKSRVVYEALSSEGITERVLVALDPTDLDRSLLTLIAESPDRYLIIVVDDCTAADRSTITRYADLSEGRVRLITIGSRYSRDPQPVDTRYLEVLPLTIAASSEIALSLGLSEDNAGIVAEYTEGYPKLAFVLAQAISYAGAAGNLIDRIRSEAVGSVLSSMLTDPNDVNLLGGLALFEKLGFEDELAQETTIACEALGIDEQAFRDVVERELHRFVASAGRYRHVTPRLFAVWLAAQFVAGNQRIASTLQTLPGTLRERILTQMKAFAGDKHIGRALQLLLNQPPFSTGVLADVDEGSARVLHVAAIVNPSLAIEAIDSMLAEHRIGELRNDLQLGRRGFINALEVLIWFDESFERAAWALLRLAMAENETWSNNATGLIRGIFRVYLGGTSASYSKRLAWARSALGSIPEAEQVLIPGLGNALLSHEMRQNPEFASRNAPPEWRPQQVKDEIYARRGAWRILIELAQAGRSVAEVATVLSGGLRTAARRGLAEDVLSDLGSIRWPPAARVHLAEAIDHLLRYDEPPPELAARFRDLRTALIGVTHDDQLTYLLTQAPWQLYEHEQLGETPRQLGETPQLIDEVASRLASEGRPTIIAAARRSRTGDFRTTSLLFERIAIKSREVDLQTAIETEKPLPEGALLGTFVGLSKVRGEAWALEELRRWLRPSLGHLIIQTAHMLPATKELADLTIEAVTEGYSDARELGRFLYGAWGRNLPAESIANIVKLLAETPEVDAAEQALGIIDQWLDAHSVHEESELDVVAVRIISLITDSAKPSSMSALYRHRVLTRLKISFDTQLRIIYDILFNLNRSLDEADLQVIDSLAERDPTRVIDAIIGIILGYGDRGFAPGVLWLESSKILSRLAGVTSASDVLRQIRKIPQDEWRELVAHVSFASPEPDPLTEFLVTKSTDDVVRGRAAYGFMYPESGWFGNESDYLRSRRSVAASWLSRARSEKMQHWVREVIEEIDERIAEAELRETEEDR